VTLTHKTDCKHSVVPDTAEPNVPVNNLVVSRSGPGLEAAKSIILTVTIAE
jgi:hypothetical protein